MNLLAYPNRPLLCVFRHDRLPEVVHDALLEPQANGPRREHPAVPTPLRYWDLRRCLTGPLSWLVSWSKGCANTNSIRQDQRWDVHSDTAVSRRLGRWWKGEDIPLLDRFPLFPSCFGRLDDIDPCPLGRGLLAQLVVILALPPLDCHLNAVGACPVLGDFEGFS